MNPPGILLPFILQVSISFFVFDTDESESVVPLHEQFDLPTSGLHRLHVQFNMYSAAKCKQTRFRIYYSHVSLERIYVSS